jgi:hypothetical protein
MEDPTEYPLTTMIDFNKLRLKTLRKYTRFFNLPTDAALSQTELAILCAHHFGGHLDVDEESTIANFMTFCTKLEKRSAAAAGLGPGDESSGKGGATSNGGSGGKSHKRERTHKEIAPGRRVAAKITGEWMLTRVIKFKKRAKIYKVEDADELTEDPMTYDVPMDHVLPLSEPSDADKPLFPRGSRVLALFPRTSTFYAATVAKRIEKGKNNRVVEYGLRFDDDEQDARGKVKVKAVRAQDVVEFTE